MFCPYLKKGSDNISSKGGIIMNIDFKERKPMSEDQLEYVKKEIIKAYFFLLGHTTFDPRVIETMKLSALSDMQKRFKAGEPW
jgi:hypothetical protein